MVASHADVLVTTQEFNTGMGVRAISHYIPETPEFIKSASSFHVLQHRFERS